MALVFDIAKMFVASSKAQLYDLFLSVATGVGLPVSTWQVGDPTATAFDAAATRLAAVEANVAGYYASGFLGSAKGDWLTLNAKDTYQEDRGEPSKASSTATIKNSTTQKFEWEPYGLTLKNITTGKTYKNKTLLTVLAGTSVVFNYEADEAGSGSTALLNSLDLQSTIKGVSITASGASVGVDGQSDESLRAACRAKISSLSPNGAYFAAEAVAKNSALTGVTSCQKAQAVPAGAGTGMANVYVSNVSSLMSVSDVASVALAVVKYGTPMGMAYTAVSATERPANITGLVQIAPVGITKEKVIEIVSQKLQAIFLEISIGGGSGPGFTTGNLGSLLLNEQVYAELERLSPGIVRKITLISDIASGVINPGELLILASVNVQVTY